MMTSTVSKQETAKVMTRIERILNPIPDAFPFMPDPREPVSCDFCERFVIPPTVSINSRGLIFCPTCWQQHQLSRSRGFNHCEICSRAVYEDDDALHFRPSTDGVVIQGLFCRTVCWWRAAIKLGIPYEEIKDMIQPMKKVQQKVLR